MLCLSGTVDVYAAMEDDGLVSIDRVRAAIRQQAGSTSEPEHVVVVDAFTGVWLCMAVEVFVACA